MVGLVVEKSNREYITYPARKRVWLRGKLLTNTAPSIAERVEENKLCFYVYDGTTPSGQTRLIRGSNN